ncbi:MAG: ABC transporter permease [Acidobacteria bacterium]|nr:ABC transporter permease [Acidobacteriota bacterium]
MNYSDIIALALRNLRQAKLRTALTAVGVVVGVAAIITMVSFGIGLQRNIIGQAFARLDAFTAITVIGADADDLLVLSEGRTALDKDEGEPDVDTATAADPKATPNREENGRRLTRPRKTLNDEAIAEIQHLDGVRFVAPIITFTGYTRFNDRTRFQVIAGATAGNDPRFKTFLAGQGFSSNDSDEVVLTENFLSAFTVEAFRRRRNIRGNPDGPFQSVPDKSDEQRQRDAQAVIGKEIELLSAPSGANSSGGSIFGIPLLNFGGSPPPAGEPDSSRFERHVFRIVGVLKNEGGVNFSPFGNANFYLPMDQAKRLRVANQSPMERMGETLMGQAEEETYRAVELRVADPGRIKPVTEKLTQLGFRAFSVTNQLEEIERIFLIINSSLALLGGIALLVASFGISNTMIMSIRERTREIGIMKAIGGSDGEIMRIFFVEASLIGLLGGTLGVIAGWGVDRIANALANKWITRQTGQAMRYVEFFSIPWYLWTGAILFAVIISLLAAIYPARSAAKVDPIKALRHE